MSTSSPALAPASAAAPRFATPFHSSEEFSALVAPEISGMFRAARRLLASDDLAWDAVQETLVRVWRTGLVLRPPRAALLRLVALSALHLARCRRRRAYHEGSAPSMGPCCADDPLGEAASAELRASLSSALQSVTVPYRRVFELFELEGRDYQEIADELAVPIGTVRSRLFRARRELRERLGEGWGEA